MNRREMLEARRRRAASSAAFRGGCIAAPPAGPRFLLVFLRGGYDSTNLLIPYSSGFYYESRPNIAMPEARCRLEHRRARAERRLGARAGGARHHRRHVRAAAGRLRARSPAPTICRAATSRPRTASSSASPRAARAIIAPGFSAAFPRPWPVRRGGNAPSRSPMRCRWPSRGATTVPNLSLKNVGKPPFDERQAKILSDMYAGHHLEAAVRSGLELRQEVAQEMAERHERGEPQRHQHQGLRAGGRAHGRA